MDFREPSRRATVNRIEPSVVESSRVELCPELVEPGGKLRPYIPGRVDMEAPEVSTQLQRLLDRQRREILVSERDDFLLRDQESQLVAALVVELRQLNTRDFGADRRRDIVDLGALCQDIGECRVGVLAVLDVLERLERPEDLALLVVPDWQVTVPSN